MLTVCMTSPTLKRRALSDSALIGEEWVIERPMVTDVTNKTMPITPQVPTNMCLVDEPNIQPSYASVEQLNVQNNTISLLSEQVSELTKAQINSNQTANMLVGRIATMMEALDASNQQLTVEARNHAEQAKRHEESLAYVHNVQQQWWDQQGALAQSSQQHHDELLIHHHQLQHLAEIQEDVNTEMCHDQSPLFPEYTRRQSMPAMPVKEEVHPPPRRLMVPDHHKNVPSMVVYAQISDPPMFDESRYEDWKRAVQWWQEINAGVDQNRMLATLGMRAKGSLKIVLQEYFGRTKLDKEGRSIDSFVILMGEKFRRPVEELVLTRVEQWSEMKRKGSEGFKAYWVRLERLQNKLSDLGIIWPRKVAFQKAFTSLCMAKEQQTLTRAALEMSPQKDSIMELKRITVKLFDNNSQDVEEVCHLGENSDDDDQEEFTEWELHAARAKTSKNRGGSVQKSIKNTQSLYGGKSAPKGSGKPEDSVCRNCSQTGHWWRNCPNLLRKPVILTKVKGGGKKGGKKTVPSSGKGVQHTHVLAEEDTDLEDTAGGDIEFSQEEPIASMEEYERSEEVSDEVGSFYDEGSAWNGTYVLYDVMHTSAVGETISVDNTKRIRYGMIDSGASATVCGVEWYQSWCNDREMQKLMPSDKQFKFGDGKIFKSLGHVILAVKVPANNGGEITFRLLTDVVAGKVPLLISHGSLCRAKCVLDFNKSELMCDGKPVALKVTPRGHIYLPMLPSVDAQNLKRVLVMNDEDNKCNLFPVETEKLDLIQLKRLHIQLGHASTNTMLRILSQAKLDTSTDALGKMIKSCGCDQTKFGYQRPLIHSNRPLKCGAHVALDIFFPIPATAMRIPWLLMICMLSRFALTAPLDSHKPEHLIDTFFCTWCQSMGKPARIISDHGRSFQGAEWDRFLTAFNIEHVMHSVRTPHENGIAERAIALIKTGFTAMKSGCPLLSNERLVTWSCMIKNLTPMLGSGVAPSEVMLGRNNLLDSLEQMQWIDSTTDGDLSHTMQVQVQTALSARSAVILEDARRTVRLGTTRNARSGSKQDFKLNDSVHLFMRDDDTNCERWIPGFRVIGLTSHHLIVERGDRIIKHPQFKAKLNDSGKLEAKEMVITKNKGRASASSSSNDAINTDMVTISANAVNSSMIVDSNTHGRVTCEIMTMRQNIKTPGTQECMIAEYDHRYLQDIRYECKSEKWIQAASTQNENGFEEQLLAVMESESVDEREEETKALSGADMNRITPKYFLRCPRALCAIQKELAGLMRIHNGQAALELTEDTEIKWKKNRRVFSMIVMKRKSASEFKARLVLRGDTISEEDSAFASAPTACRGSVPMLLTWAVTFRLSVFMVDISQAFLQADELSPTDKIVTTVPPYIKLPNPREMPRCPDSGMPILVEKTFVCYLSMNTRR